MLLLMVFHLRMYTYTYIHVLIHGTLVGHTVDSKSSVAPSIIKPNTHTHLHGILSVVS